MLGTLLIRAGVKPVELHALSLGAVGLSLGLWIRAKTIGQDLDQRGNAERRAIFVGLWPPMFWLIGDLVERRQPRRVSPLRRR